MPQRRRLTVLAVVAVLAAAAPAPVPALAQSAGDEQYEDPFAGQDPSAAQPEPEPQAPAAEPAAPAQSTPAPESSTPAAPTAESASQPQPELPRTGLDTAPVLAIGAVLLGTGVALRVRLRERS